jgi:hypothetical protein
MHIKSNFNGLMEISGILLSLILLFSFDLYAVTDSDGRVAFTRGGWAGARYIAMGKTAESVVDDIYSIYWNPAGLRELLQKQSLTPDEIKQRAESGAIDSITEKDLTNFSEKEYSRLFVETGASCTLLDPDKDAGFAGIAFSAFKGVLGIGYYGNYLKYPKDAEDNSIKGKNSLSSAAYLSYGGGTGVASLGMSLKTIYVDNVKARYYGLGADLGMQIELIPLVKIGIVVQDIGTGLKPAKNYDNTGSRYDFTYPVVKIGASVTDRSSDFIVAVSGIRKLEENDFKINFGFQYNIFKFSSLYLGVSSSAFTTGISLKFFNMDITYAFMYDKEDFGYSNTLSFTLII